MKEKNNITIYKNRYINTSINYYDGIEPSLPIENTIGIMKITLWNRINITNIPKISELINNIEKIFNGNEILEKPVKVTYIMLDEKVIFNGEICKEIEDVDNMKSEIIKGNLKVLLTIKGEDEYGLEDLDYEISIFVK